MFWAGMLESNNFYKVDFYLMLMAQQRDKLLEEFLEALWQSNFFLQMESPEAKGPIGHQARQKEDLLVGVRDERKTHPKYLYGAIIPKEDSPNCLTLQYHQGVRDKKGRYHETFRTEECIPKNIMEMKYEGWRTQVVFTCGKRGYFVEVHRNNSTRKSVETPKFKLGIVPADKIRCLIGLPTD
jgi:hypothetical protein